MQSLAIDRTCPNTFILVSDGTFPHYQSSKDHVWTLNLDGADPQPFYLGTTYGLRAKSMRLFPNFMLDNQRISKASQFTQPPTITSYTPASVKIKCHYQDRAVIQFSCYLPEPEVLVGCIEISNLIETPLDMTVQLAVALAPMGKGQPSYPEKLGTHQFLSGKTEGIEPVLFMTGGPSAISNPFPALSIQVSVQPHKTQQVSWALVSKEIQAVSLEKAKQIITGDWQDKYLAHSMRFASQSIHIKTDFPDWDAAFYLAGVNALTHFVKDDQDAKAPTFIKIRLPDQVSSLENEPHNNDHLTNLDLIHLWQLLLPAHVDTASVLLEKHLTDQIDNLQITPGENNQNGKRYNKGCPLLAPLALEIYEVVGDAEFLERVYPNLSQLFHSWVIDPVLGSEKDKIVWHNLAQLQIDTGLFTFDVWEALSKGLDIKKAESPALYAMLYKDAKALYKIGKILGKRSEQRFYSHWQKELFKRVESCWQENENAFGYQDIQSHLSPSRELYYPGPVKKHIEINKNFTKAQRLQIHIYTSDELTRSCIVRITGESPLGEPLEEVFKSPNILWVLGRAHLTTANLFRKLNSISFDGLRPEDNFIIETANYQQRDITCLLPLWGDAGSQSHRQSLAAKLPELSEGPFSRCIPETWQCDHPLPDDLVIKVNVLWNTLVIEGLLRQGMIEKAAAIYTCLMDGILRGLKNYHGFYPLFENQNGHPGGQYNAISGLVPVQLFLKIAGIKLISPTCIALWGKNPFPWPIKIYWQGLSLIKNGTQSSITFPNGAIYQHDSGKPVLLTPNSN